MSEVQPEHEAERRRAMTGRRVTRATFYGRAADRALGEFKRRVKGGPASPVATATMRARGGLTLPAAIRNEVHLQEGDQVIVSVQDGKVVLTPAAVIPRDQEWFWTADWQAKEAEADADRNAGRVVTFDSDEAFLAALDDLD